MTEVSISLDNFHLMAAKARMFRAYFAQNDFQWPAGENFSHVMLRVGSGGELGWNRCKSEKDELVAFRVKDSVNSDSKMHFLVAPLVHALYLYDERRSRRPFLGAILPIR